MPFTCRKMIETSKLTIPLYISDDFQKLPLALVRSCYEVC
jgi:hypothetical protein